MSTPVKKAPLMTDSTPLALINLDPAAAARSIAAAVSEKNDEKDFLDEKITFQFYNLEQPGHSAYFCYGICTNPESFTLEHNEVYTKSRGEVRYIETRQTPVYEFRQQGFHKNGLPKMKKERVGWQPRFQCRQLNDRQPRMKA